MPNLRDVVLRLTRLGPNLNRPGPKHQDRALCPNRTTLTLALAALGLGLGLSFQSRVIIVGPKSGEREVKPKRPRAHANIKKAWGCSDRIATHNPTKDTFKWRKIDTRRHKNTNGAKQALSRFLSLNRTSKNAIQPKLTNKYVTELYFLKNENLSQLENWKPVSWKHKKLALAVENWKFYWTWTLDDFSTRRF